MENVKISVIMPCLNSQNFIRESIESVLNQTLKEIEIIIVDGGSEDKTLEIVQEYQKDDSRIHLLHSDKKSMGYQYNLGIKNARGTYIGFVESDDYIHSKMYEILFDIAEREQLDFIKSDFDMFINDKENQLLLNYSVLSARKEKLYNMILNPMDHPEILHRDVNMWNGIFSRSFLSENKIVLSTTEGAAFQDMGFTIKSFIAAKKIMYVKIPSYYYRKDNVTASVYNRMRHVKFVMDEFQIIWEYLEQKQIKEPFRATIFKRCFYMFCACYDYIKFHGDCNKSVEENLDDYIKYLKNCFRKLSYSEIRAEQLDDILYLSLLDRPKEFEYIRKCKDYLVRKNRYIFFETLKKRSIIIFGAGERGTAICAFLKRNGVEGILCFCDNDKSKENRKILNMYCVLPTMLEKQFHDKLAQIVFVVANESFYLEISGQLSKIGIRRENVIRGINILPHEAFELETEIKVPC